jgi:hypothetical protein
MIERLAWETRRRAERLRVRPSHRRPDQRTPRAAGRPAGSSARRADDHPGSVAPTPRRPTPATFVPQVRVPPVPPPALRRNEHELERVGFALGHLPYVLEVGNGSAAESLPADKATHGIACRLERMPHGLAAQRVRAERLTWRAPIRSGWSWPCRRIATAMTCRHPAQSQCCTRWTERPNQRIASHLERSHHSDRTGTHQPRPSLW